MPQLRIDTEEMINLAMKLESFSRSALPVAVRNTLNNTAFEARKIIIDDRSDYFDNRRRGLFKAIVTVEKSKERNVKDMKARTGYSIANKRVAKIAVRMGAHETGGSLLSNSIPTLYARGGNPSGRVLSKYRSISPSHIVTGGFRKQRSMKGRFVASHHVAWREKKFVKTGKGIYEVSSFSKSGKRPTIIRNMIYSYQSGREVNVPHSPLIAQSGKTAAKKMPKFFKKNFDAQYNRAMKKKR